VFRATLITMQILGQAEGMRPDSDPVLNRLRAKRSTSSPKAAGAYLSYLYVLTPAGQNRGNPDDE
jgi:hypothetical protein